MHKVETVYKNGSTYSYDVDYPRSYVNAIIDNQNTTLEEVEIDRIFVDNHLEAEAYKGKLYRTPPPAIKGDLFLVRGLPGSGKTTIAQQLTQHYVEADMFFMKDGRYNFDPAKLPQAHKWCLQQTKDFMTLWGYEKIAVSNTFTEEWEMAEYVNLAKKNGYKVHTLVVENRHGSESIHDVPEATMQAMEDRFDIKLY
tara:strand:+ start:95 stop:685 length:591 start_codon:yes stop_codon:yes gene_type:complete